MASEKTPLTGGSNDAATDATDAKADDDVSAKTTTLTAASPGGRNTFEYSSTPPYSRARRLRERWFIRCSSVKTSPLPWIFLCGVLLLVLWFDMCATDRWGGNDNGDSNSDNNEEGSDDVATTDKYVKFPDDFVWGAATSAYQIEGGDESDGRGPSIWDVWCDADPSNCHGDDGRVADDHYHHMEDDVKIIMKEALGLKAYRFSLSWSRILPSGRGEVNPAGVAFYDRLIDALIEAGIEPWVTLYHWDLPQALYDDYGGWSDRTAVDDFGEYARICYGAFGDRVKHWITINEAWTVAVHGHDEGSNAPGLKISAEKGTEPYDVAHILLLAHARAANIYRKEFAPLQGGQIGISNNGDFRWPLDPTKEGDALAATRAMEFFLGWFADPIFGKHADIDADIDADNDTDIDLYPKSMRERLGDRLPYFTPEESVEIRGSADFFGLNHYSSLMASQPTAEAGYWEYWADMHVNFTVRDEWPRNCMGWAVVPDGCGEMLRWIAHRYGREIPVVITENGSCEDEPDVETAKRDEGRREFLEGYIRSAGLAVESGEVDLRGYFAWSLMDNFEWQYGYSKRFGLVRVDYDTMERTPKSSALWYRDTIQANGGNILREKEG